MESRRDFLKSSAAGGFAVGGLLGLGLDLRAEQAHVRSLIADPNVTIHEAKAFLCNVRKV
jgi:anaerobic selenocysteine-containing dehydrogenase